MARIRRNSRWSSAWGLALAVILTFGLTACTDADDDGPTTSEPSPSSVMIQQQHSPALGPLEVLQPYINGLCLEIDRADTSDPPADYGDANLVTGNDADGSPSYQLPACTGTTTWTDWDELATDVGAGFDITQFKLLDTISKNGIKDPSAFPFSDERVGEASVLSKQDIVQGAIAVNQDYVYVGTWRQATNGSSSYFWVWTQNPPHIHGDNENRLLYDIVEGDILFAGDFNPATNKVNVFEVYTAKAGVNLTAVPAGDVATPENPAIWQLETNPNILGTLNTTEMGPGTLFDITADIPQQNLEKNGNFSPGAFGEGAAPLSLFTGGAACGNVFYGTVITRPSRSRTSDLKDLLGPFILDLGQIEPNITTAANCEGDLLYKAEPVINNNPVTDPTCDWTINCGGPDILVSNDCTEATLPNAASSSSVTCDLSVTVTSPQAFPGCEGEETASQDVYPELTVTVSTTPYCLDPDGANGAVSSFDYTEVSVTGGSGSYTRAWTFTNESGGAAPMPTSATNASGNVTVSEAGPNTTYRATLMVTDDAQTEADGQTACTAMNHDDNIPLAPLTANLTLVTPNAVCQQGVDAFNTLDDARTYEATVSGGTGKYDVAWTPNESETYTAAGTCQDLTGTTSLTHQCTIDPNDNTELCGDLTIDANFTPAPLNDGFDAIRATCEAQDTNDGTYSKTLTVTGGITL